MEELPPVTSERHERDDVVLLAGVRERPLEHAVEPGGQEQLTGQPARAQERRERRERPVQRARARIRGVELVQLVVERPDAVRDGDPLGHAREAPRALRRAAEAPGKMLRRRLPAPGAGDDPPAPGPSTGTRRPASSAARDLAVEVACDDGTSSTGGASAAS